MAGQTTAVAIINKYPADKFNALIPVASIQEIGPLHRIVVNEVKIESNPDKKDAYKEKNGEYALTKKALAKLMAGGNVQVVDSRSTLPKKCQRCAEIAKSTKQAPKCFECPHTDDIAHQVTIAVPQPDGTLRMVRGTKEIRMNDAKASMTDAQFRQFKPFAAEQCETKALNRALREGLMVQSTYKKEDLDKPFVVAMVTPNFSDPEMKAAMIRRYERGEDALFGTSPKQIQGSAMQALPEGQETHTVEVVSVEDDDDSPPSLGGDVPTFDGELFGGGDAEREPGEDPIECEGCACIVEPFTDTKGKHWEPREMADWTRENLGRIFCESCAGKEMRSRLAKKK